MSADGEALLRAVLVDPADDLPRLAYADWFDEQGEADRAEFIRCQVQLGRIGHEPEGCRKRRCPCRRLARRAEALCQQSGAAWMGLTQRALPRGEYRFSRGFVAWVEMAPWPFRRCARALFSRNPVVSVRLSTRAALRR